MARLFLSLVLAVALAACNGLISGDPGSASATSAAPTPSCDRPPAVFSRGAYPANVEDIANAEYGLVGSIAQPFAVIPACDDGNLSPEDSTFDIDRIAWPAGDSGFLAPSTISTVGLRMAAAGTPMLLYGSGGTFGSGPGEGCTSVDVDALDLAQYPNAPDDMVRLRAFLADRATYDGLRAATFVVEATITAVGDPVYSNNSGYPPYPPETSVFVTLQTNAIVCGTPGATIGAWHTDSGYGGAADPLGEQPAVGTHALFVVREDSVDHTLTIDATYPTTDAARLSGLLSTPPALSL